MATLRAAPLTSTMLVEVNRVENCRGVTSRRFVPASTRSVTAPELGLLRCRIGNAGGGRRHATKVAAAAAAATTTFEEAMASTDGAIRDMTDALKQLQEHDDPEMIEQDMIELDCDDECVFCDVLTRSRSCRAHHYGSQNPVPAEKRSSEVGVESKKPLRLGSASWDLLD